MHRKREFIAESSQPAKKARTERETGRLQQQNLEKKFRKRKLQEVIDELIVRVANNDRQLTNNLIRELDAEHVRVVRSADFPKSAELMMKACLSAKVDSVASKVFNCLMGIFERGSHEQRRKFILSLEKEADELFSKNNLDEGILKIYTTGINDSLITASQIPEKVLLVGRRSLGYSSLSSTSNRTASIRFHVAICVSTEHDIPEVSLDVEIQLCRLSRDRDFRVRKAASEGLLAMANSGYFLAKKSYKTVKTFMKDVDLSIRITAIQLLIYFANRKGLQMEKEMMEEQNDGKAPVSISDDAFSAICDAMNDIEIAVRVQAAKTLGDFETVSDDLIEQTLDKKMMRSNAASQVVKVEQSLFALSKKAHHQKDRRWKFSKKAPPKLESKGGWSRGKELNATCPEGAKEEEEEESIIPHGACGAFVTALEDEFMDVRKAAVYSLGRLACTRPTFAVSALEYLADMFNDEIADVRLDAINALTPLIAHGQLNSEQLNVILKCLDDAMPESRQAMRELLKRAQFVDVNCIEMCVRALLACMKRFPKDKEQVYSCMADIGFNHAVQVQSIMRSLLDIHLIFHTRETSIEDQDYVGKLIIVLNAASQTPSMVHVMPEFVHRHYRFLRSSFPELVRPIRVLDEQQQCGKVGKSEEKTTEKAEEILKKTYARLCEAASLLQIADRNRQRDDIFRDTSAISLYNENVSGAARLIFCLGEVSATVDSAAQSVLRGGELINVKQLIEHAIFDMLCVAQQFSGLSNIFHGYLLHCRLFLNFLDMLVWVIQMVPTQAEIIQAASIIINDVKERMGNLRELSGSFVSFLQSCRSVFFPRGVASEVDEKRKILTPSSIVALLEKSFPRLPRKLPNIAGIHLKCAKIITPHKDSAVESVLKFFANLPHGIPMEFQLINMQIYELDAVRIRITYPDGKSDLLKPRSDDFTQNGKTFTVNTQAKITCATPWSEPAEIDIVIGVMTMGGAKDAKTEVFVPLFSSPSSFSPAHVRVRIHPQAR